MVFDNSKGYKKRLGISRKNQFNAVIKGNWDIEYFVPWPLYNQTVVIFGIGIILILLTNCYCFKVCFGKCKIVSYEKKVDRILKELNNSSMAGYNNYYDKN